jgi:hypothetical protein
VPAKRGRDSEILKFSWTLMGISLLYMGVTPRGLLQQVQIHVSFVRTALIGGQAAPLVMISLESRVTSVTDVNVRDKNVITMI